MSHFWRGAAKVGLAASAVGLGVAIFSSQAAFALGTVGTATPTNPLTSAPLTGTLGSNQQFGLALSPTGTLPAACSGNDTTNGTLEQSYLVPAAVNPATLTYTGGSINGTGNYSLYDATGAQVGPTPPALSDQVVAIPTDIVFGGTGPNFPVSVLIPSGTSAQWNIGIVCAVPPSGGGAATVSDYWNTLVTFTVAGNDANGYTWTYGTSAVTPESPLAVGLPIGGAAVIGAGVFINRRRRSTTAGSAVVA